MASAVSSSKNSAAMSPSTPTVELTRSPVIPTVSEQPIASMNPNRRSRIIPSDPSKRLSTASLASTISNPSRDAPKQPERGDRSDRSDRSDRRATSPLPDQIPRAISPAPSTSSASAAPMSPAPASSLRNKIPSFPPPQQSRISMISLASNRDSWHPQFVSSLSYALVRDFAYPAVHPLHYGPTITEGLSTPGGDLNEAMGASSGGAWFSGSGGAGFRRLSDPVPSAAEGGIWADAATFRRQQNNQPPPLNFSDGPPWSEDDDLQSPVVVPKMGKHKSAMPIGRTAGRNPRSLHLQAVANGIGEAGADNHSYYTHSTVDTSLPHDGAPGEACGPGGTISYDPNADSYDYFESYSDEETAEVNMEDTDYYNSRFSKDYQFTIASPAEEMHGKAVALFDFVQENENELPLVEGQVVWVSYRHGMGWLVAEDPKTGESGLVPEEYVCLLRDMASNEPPAPHDAHAHVSTFSTSSQDILPLDHESVDKMRRDQEAHWNEEEQRRASGESGRGGGDIDGTPRLGSVAFEDSRTEEERLEEERKREELERELAGVEGGEVQERVREEEVHRIEGQGKGNKSNGL